SSGILRRPARYIAKEKPVICQTAAITTAIMATGKPNSILPHSNPAKIVVSVYHFGSIPKNCRKWLNTVDGLSNHCQTTPVTINERAIGNKKILRNNDSPRNFYSRRSEEHTSELQSRFDLVCRLLLEKKKIKHYSFRNVY